MSFRCRCCLALVLELVHIGSSNANNSLKLYFAPDLLTNKQANHICRFIIMSGQYCLALCVRTGSCRCNLVHAEQASSCHGSALAGTIVRS